MSRLDLETLKQAYMEGKQLTYHAQKRRMSDRSLMTTLTKKRNHIVIRYLPKIREELADCPE